MTSLLPHYDIPAPDRTTSSGRSLDDSDMPVPIPLLQADTSWANKFGYDIPKAKKTFAQKLQEEEERRANAKIENMFKKDEPKKRRAHSEPNRLRRNRPMGTRIGPRTGFSVALEKITAGAQETVAMYKQNHGYKDPKRNLLFKCWSPKLRVGLLNTIQGSFVRFYKDRIEYDVLVQDESSHVLMVMEFRHMHGFCIDVPRKALRFRLHKVMEHFLRYYSPANPSDELLVFFENEKDLKKAHQLVGCRLQY